MNQNDLASLKDIISLSSVLQDIFCFISFTGHSLRHAGISLDRVKLKQLSVEDKLLRIAKYKSVLEKEDYK